MPAENMCGCTHEKQVHNHSTDFCKIEGCVCQEFIPSEEEWKEAKERWDYESDIDERMLSEAFHQRDVARDDNEYPSGSTDLGNRGGTTFCY